MPQSLATILVHAVFSTRNRLPLLRDPHIRQQLYAIVSASMRDHEALVLEIGGTADHLHVLFYMGRSQTVSSLVGEAKRLSSLWIKGKDEQYSDFAWQGGYSVFSVSSSMAQRVVSYIRNQEAHHAKRTFQDEVRELLQKHGVSFDERFVWD